MATISTRRRTGSSCATSLSSSIGRTRSATALRSTPTTPTTRWRWASRTRCSPSAASLAIRSTYQVEGIINSEQGYRCTRRLQRALQIYPSGLGQDLLRRKQPGDHRKPGGDEHELLRLLPGAHQRSDKPERQEHRLLREPAPDLAATSLPRLADRESRSSPTRKTRKRRSSSCSGSSGRDPEEVGRAWRLHLQQGGARIRRIPERHPYNKAFYDTMFKVKDFWAVPEYAELSSGSQSACLSGRCRRGRVRSKETLDALAADWTATFKKYSGRLRVRRGGAACSRGRGDGCPGRRPLASFGSQTGNAWDLVPLPL